MFTNKYLLNFFKYRRKANLYALSICHRSKSACTQVEATQVDTSKKLSILFFGTDSFSLPSLSALHSNNNLKCLGVVTSFKNPANCVRIYAEKQKLPLYRWPITPEICRPYDLGVVVSFGHLIPEHIIKAFPHGMINVHASLLPRWRGAAPIIYAIMNGEAYTGVSIMRIEPKRFDVGDILAQRELPIKEGIFMPDLHTELANAGASLLAEIINDFPCSFENTSKQNNAEATFAPKVTAALTEVHWMRMSAQELYRRFRALFGFKHLCTQFQGKNVQLIDIRVPEAVTANAKCALQHLECGAFAYQRDKRCLLVRCANDSYIEVHKLRVEGKKVMTAIDFDNGFLKQLNQSAFSFTNKIY